MKQQQQTPEWWVILTIDEKVVISPDSETVICELNKGTQVKDKLLYPTIDEALFAVKLGFEKARQRQILTESITRHQAEIKRLQEELDEIYFVEKEEILY